MHFPVSFQQRTWSKTSDLFFYDIKLWILPESDHCKILACFLLLCPENLNVFPFWCSKTSIFYDAQTTWMFFFTCSLKLDFLSLDAVRTLIVSYNMKTLTWTRERRLTIKTNFSLVITWEPWNNNGDHKQKIPMKILIFFLVKTWNHWIELEKEDLKYTRRFLLWLEHWNYIKDHNENAFENLDLFFHKYKNTLNSVRALRIYTRFFF